MRITIAVDTWAPIGGSERYAIDLASELASGHAVTVVAASADDAVPRRGFELVREPAYGDAALDRVGRRRLLRTFDATRPDVVLVLTVRSLRAFLALAGELPLVRFVQDHVPFCPGSSKTLSAGEPCESALGWTCVRRFLGPGCEGSRRAPGSLSPWPVVRQLARRRAELDGLARCAAVVVASEYMRTELVRAGVTPEHVAVVPYFTRLDRRPASTGELDPATRALVASAASAREPFVLAAGRFAHPDKGFDHLLTALGKLVRPRRAIVAGDGPARDWLEHKARTEGLGARVHFPGWLPARALDRLYASAAVVAFPSTWNEPFGLVGLEAAVHGKPVVAYDVGGVSTWLVDGVTGLRVPRGDRDAFARALERLLDDPELATRLGRAARERVRAELGPRRHVERLEALFERVLGGQRSNGASNASHVASERSSPRRAPATNAPSAASIHAGSPSARP